MATLHLPLAPTGRRRPYSGAFATQAYKDGNEVWRDKPRTYEFTHLTFRLSENGHIWHTRASGIPLVEHCGNLRCKICATYAAQLSEGEVK